MRAARIGLVVFVIAMLLVARQVGVFDQLSDPAHLKDSLVRLGPSGYAAFLVAYALLQPFGVPGTVFVMAAPLIWPWPVAFALNMAGTMAASVIGFSFARFVARDWIRQSMPTRFAKYEEALERRGFVTVAVLRFVFWMPQVLHAFLGLSKVRFWTHFWGSFVGYLVPLLLVSFFGQKLFDIAKNLPKEAWFAIGAVVLGVALGVWALRRRKTNPAPKAADEADRG